MEKQAGALSQLLDLVAQEARETQAARSDRDAARGRWERELRFDIGIARAVLERNEQADLAARLLPSERQIAHTEPLPDEDPQPTPDEGAGTGVG